MTVAISNDLTEQLNQAGYVCDDGFGTAVAAALSTRPVAGAFLFGPIGAGKTYLPEVLARILGADYYFYQCFPGTREDDLLVKMLPAEDSVSGVRLYDGVMMQAVEAAQNGPADRKVILALDEWDKTRPSADSFLLDFLQTGRIQFAGRTVAGDLSRLMVFLTFNVERELSEPLLRRLPKIQFEPLSPSVVYRALRLTHADHPYLYSAVILYERCLMADLPKPATIQELRQLLDAVALLGDKADWDSLVFQFVTKSVENHELLRLVEGRKSRWQRTIRPRLDTAAYEAPRDIAWPEGDGPVTSMPSLARARGFDDRLDPASGPPDLALAGGVLELTRSAYNQVVRLVDQPGSSPESLGDVARVHGRLLVLEQPVPLSRLDDIAGLWGENGEVLLVEPLAGWEDVKALPTWSPLEIIKFSRDEILAKCDGVDLRWTPDNGAEIIVNLARRHVFQQVFGRDWDAPGEGKWIGRKGLINLKRQAEGQHPGVAGQIGGAGGSAA